METRLKEHWNAGIVERSAAAEYVWENHHPISAGPWWRTGAVSEEVPAHSDDTLRGALQPKWRTGSPRLLDHCDEEAGREEQSSPTFDLQ